MTSMLALCQYPCSEVSRSPSRMRDVLIAAVEPERNNAQRVGEIDRQHVEFQNARPALKTRVLVPLHQLAICVIGARFEPSVIAPLDIGLVSVSLFHISILSPPRVFRNKGNHLLWAKYLIGARASQAAGKHSPSEQRERAG